jgi:anti-anti-sigma factor
MEYSLVQEGDIQRVKFYGNLKASARTKMKEVMEIIPGSSSKQWDLDVTEFEYIDSSGLGMLIELQEIAQSNGIRVSISGANPLVRKMFDLSRFETLFTIND